MMNYLGPDDDVVCTTSVSEAESYITCDGKGVSFPAKRHWCSHKICRRNKRYIFVSPDMNDGRVEWQPGWPTHRLERSKLESVGRDLGPDERATMVSQRVYYTTAKKNEIEATCGLCPIQP